MSTTSHRHSPGAGQPARRHALAGIAALLLILTLSADAQPKLRIQQAEIDLGTVYNGAVVRAPITISNAGTEPLNVTNVRTSCGCTTVKQPSNALKPGESATIEVEFNSAGFRGRSVKYVYLQTNDPSADHQTITLRVDIKEELVPVPPVSVVWLGNIPVGKPYTKSMAFANSSAEKLSVKRVSGLPPSAKASFRPKSLAPADTLEVLLTIRPESEGYVNAEAFLETSSANQPRVPFRITYIGVKSE